MQLSRDELLTAYRTMRTIREFERQGLAEFAGRSVRIPHPTRLSEELPPGY